MNTDLISLKMTNSSPALSAYNQAYGNYNKAYSVLLRTLEDCRHVSDQVLDDYKQARDEFYQSHEALIKDFETNND